MTLQLAASPAAAAGPSPDGAIGCVVIGRNEAPRLARCLASVLDACTDVVYVDSGSTDGSPAIAAAAGVPVVALDRSRPFSAARARNAGLDDLVRRCGERLAFVQFVDGDCTLEPGWLAAAATALRRDPGIAVVSGRSRERAASRSLVRRLCDIELDVTADESAACGGVAMMRVPAFRAVGGFDSRLRAGEEPELCLRLRRAGWRIAGLPVPMMQHELAAPGLRLWWRRSVRCGGAWLESWWKHRRGPEHYCRKEVLRTLVWGALLPLAVAGSLVTVGPAGGLVALGYLAPAVRAHAWSRRHGHHTAASILFAVACVAAKFPELVGIAVAVPRLRPRPVTRRR